MNVAIVGRSQVNGVLQKHLAEQGFIPFLVDDIDDIREFNGEKFKFTLRTSRNSINAGYVIVTEELSNERYLDDTPLKDTSYRSIDDIGDLDKRGTENWPMAFILDFPSESPAYITAEALENAARLAVRKKRVLYLARFMRTAGSDVESLYKRARNSGVTFIKYNELSINYDQDAGLFQIQAKDGYDSIRIETPEVHVAGKAVPGSGIGKIAKLLRLKQDKNGFVNEGKSFLFPTLTSRDGIYFLNTASLTKAEELLERIQFTVSEIKSEVNRIYKNSTGCAKVLDMPMDFSGTDVVINDKHAVVDAGKCAFCYTCFRACPHAAMAPDYENSVMKNLSNSCQACGICVSVCPADAVRITGEDREEGRIESNTLKILCCENSGEIAVKKLRDELSEVYGKVSVTSVRCGGDINVEAITSALKQHEKVLVVTCMDDACKHFEGNKRAQRFVERVKEMLKASGMDENRVECLKISHAMPYVMLDGIREMI